MIIGETGTGGAGRAICGGRRTFIAVIGRWSTAWSEAELFG
jgi:hypothetical protein